MAMKQYISLSEPLCGIDTYKDVLNVKTGATTRIIKKMVLDGNTVVKKKSGNAPFQIYCPHGIKPPTDGIYWLCSHYPAVPNTTTWTTYDYLISFSVGDMGESENDYFRIRDTSRASYNADQFSDYLAQQYANGTPVTVWYILTTPETSVTTLPKGLSGTFEGSLTQTGAPTPASPIYPTANSINAFLNKKYFRYETSTDTLTTLPADLYADGTAATVGLVGNMYQASGVSPTTPIQPQECGEMTWNLFDKSNFALVQVTSTAYRYGTSLGVLSQGTYTFNATKSAGAQSIYLTEKLNGVYSQTTISSVPFSFTADGESEYIIRTANNTGITWEAEKYSDMMLNTGETALPYEPFGVKIPISSANTTTPIYLGEVQSERQIKEFVLTGEETIYYNATNKVFYFVLPTAYYTGSVRTTPLYCSHYLHIDDGRPFAEMPNNSVYIASYGSDIAAYVYTTDYTDTTTYKAYLAAQYAVGTPVTVWYVLATPTTGIVNEPLRKIGDYADEVSGITIPTIAGADSFDVLTTLKPSEASLAYTGWHDATVKEWDGSEWQ